MDFELLLIITIIVTVPITILAVIVAVRNKSIGCGLLAFLVPSVFLATFIAAVELLHWFVRNIPISTQAMIGIVAQTFGLVALNLVGLQNIRMVNVGKNVPPGLIGNLTGWQIVAGILVLHCGLTTLNPLIFDTDIQDVMRQNTPWWILAVLLFVISFFSFEFREKGMVQRGRVILFSDIEHAEWEDWKDKTRLKIRLKNKERERVIKIPRKFVTPVDNYVKTNFPRP